MKVNQLVMIGILLLIDAISTIYLLANVTGAYEINPINTIFPNHIYIWVVVNHIIVYAFLLLVNNKYKHNAKRNKELQVGLVIINILYLIIVINNVYQIIKTKGL